VLIRLTKIPLRLGREIYLSNLSICLRFRVKLRIKVTLRLSLALSLSPFPPLLPRLCAFESLSQRFSKESGESRSSISSLHCSRSAGDEDLVLGLLLQTRQFVFAWAASTAALGETLDSGRLFLNEEDSATSGQRLCLPGNIFGSKVCSLPILRVVFSPGEISALEFPIQSLQISVYQGKTLLRR
jgi:hypothetical protein